MDELALGEDLLLDLLSLAGARRKQRSHLPPGAQRR
jgi:hypothetical protein